MTHLVLAGCRAVSEKREVELFKGNSDIRDALLRNAGKTKSKYDGASLHDQLINGKGFE